MLDWTRLFEAADLDFMYVPARDVSILHLTKDMKLSRSVEVEDKIYARSPEGILVRIRNIAVICVAVYEAEDRQIP